MTMTAEERRALQWIAGRDTGESSKAIWAVMMGEEHTTYGSVPLDAGDFGRCHRLLLLMPEWRERMPEVAELFPTWAPLVEAWDELTAMYEQVVRGSPGTRDVAASGRMQDRMAELRWEAPHAR